MKNTVIRISVGRKTLEKELQRHALYKHYENLALSRKIPGGSCAE